MEGGGSSILVIRHPILSGPKSAEKSKLGPKLCLCGDFAEIMEIATLNAIQYRHGSDQSA